MSDHDFDHYDFNQHDFDRAARAHHNDALTSLSMRTRTQLHHRLQAALAGQARTTRRKQMPVWSWATAAALVLAFAFGLPWRSAHEPAPTTSTTLAAADANDSTLATLDQSPDFYLWLASSDAVALASE